MNLVMMTRVRFYNRVIRCNRILKGFAQVVFLALLGTQSLADTHYVVSENPGAAAPFTSWATAGTNIHEVFNAAVAGSAPRVLWVTNGTYVITNTMYSEKTIEVRSVNGRNVTILEGNGLTNHCIHLHKANSSVVDGFTLQHFNKTALRGGYPWPFHLMQISPDR